MGGILTPREEMVLLEILRLKKPSVTHKEVASRFKNLTDNQIARALSGLTQKRRLVRLSDRPRSEWQIRN